MGKSAANAEKKPRAAKGADKKEKVPALTYWQQTRLPVYSLAFVLPMVLFYEVGVILVNRSVRATHGYMVYNASDWLIRRLMESFLTTVGLGSFFMSGVLIAVVLVVWQVASRRPWTVKASTLCGMLLESSILALVLPILVYYLIEPMLPATIETGPAFARSALFANVVMSFGAGVYEEFIFRLVLVGLVTVVLNAFTGLNWRVSALSAVVLGAVIFAAAHHVGEFAEDATWPVFLFRVGSGLFFGVIYYFRGFGIAAGSHALYDVVYFVFLAGEGASG